MTNYIFPPVVPANLTRIRISVMATHSKKQMDYLLATLNETILNYKLK